LHNLQYPKHHKLKSKSKNKNQLEIQKFLTSISMIL
jgi:hypothetical protein